MEQNYATFLSGRSALEYWGVPYLLDFLEPKNQKIQREYVVFTDRSIHVPQGVSMRTCRIPGASKYTQGEVCTLPLVFLQVARYYEIHELIYLAIQMTSYRGRMEPLVTLSELRSCAEELVGHHGRRKALRALKYAEEGCRSPMEALLYMFLSLPNCLGGCGLRGMKFNHRIITSDRRTYYADLYLPSKKLIIEYNSTKHHNNTESIERDAQRRTNLRAEGYKVEFVTYSQMSDIYSFEKLVQTITETIGKRIRIRACKFFPGYRALRELLMKGGNLLTSSCEKVKVFEVPQFHGVQRAYVLYEAAYERWIARKLPGFARARSPG